MVRLILLLLAVFGLLMGSHYFLYRSAVRAAIIEQAGIRRALLGILLFLSLSFPASIILVKNWRNILTECFFILAATWIALFVNLFMAAAAGWIFAGAVKLAGQKIDPKWIALAAAALAVLFTAHGVWKARHPQLHRIEIALEGLPEQWRDRTVVQLSDLHLGHIHGTAFMERVARKVNALEPEMVFITGDVFDGLGGDYPSFVPAINKLNARYGVFFVPGNHELYSRAASLLDNAKLRVLRDEIVEVEGLQIIGVGYPGLRDEKELTRIRAGLSREKPGILLFHTPTDIFQQGESPVHRHFTTYWRPDTSCTLNRNLGIDLQLSGHTHAGQVFPIGWLTRLIYKGRDRGLHRDGSFNLYVSSGTGTFGPPVRTSGRSEIVVIILKKKEGGSGK